MITKSQLEKREIPGAVIWTYGVTIDDKAGTTGTQTFQMPKGAEILALTQGNGDPAAIILAAVNPNAPPQMRSFLITEMNRVLPQRLLSVIGSFQYRNAILFVFELLDPEQAA